MSRNIFNDPHKYGRLVTLALQWQPFYKKENSEFKPAVRSL